MRHPRTHWWMVPGLAALTACARDQPPAPQQLYSITGHVRLTGFLVDHDGAYAGTRVVGDADGVMVELLHGSKVVGRTTTVDGAYRFSGLKPGDYRARSQVVGDIGDRTTQMVIAVSDVVAADTLRLSSRGDLFPVPNPFADTTQVYFDVSDTMWVDVNVLDVGGNFVKNLISLEVLPMRHAVFWYGRDTMGRPVPGSLFWVTFVAGNDIRAQLLFR